LQPLYSLDARHINENSACHDWPNLLYSKPAEAAGSGDLLACKSIIEDVLSPNAHAYVAKAIKLSSYMTNFRAPDIAHFHFRLTGALGRAAGPFRDSAYHRR
jgi:hypothetical protein